MEEAEELLFLLALNAACVRRRALVCADPMLLPAPVVLGVPRESACHTLPFRSIKVGGWECPTCSLITLCVVDVVTEILTSHLGGHTATTLDPPGFFKSIEPHNLNPRVPGYPGSEVLNEGRTAIDDIQYIVLLQDAVTRL